MTQRLLRYGPLVASAAVLVWHSLQFNFVTDDAFISFVYSRNLAEHGQLVFNPGLDPVEGCTNFLWTFLLGLLMLAGLPPEVTSLVLGTGFALFTLVVVFRLSQRLFDPDRPSPWDHVAPALLALSAGYACWSSGGLETQMFTAWVVLALHYYVRGDAEPLHLRRVGWALALAAMTRPEGLLVAAVLGCHRLAIMILRDRRIAPTRDELLCAAYFLILWAPWFAWRWWYYGYPLPNTYYVKAAGPTAGDYEQRLRAVGLYYVWQFLRQSGLLYAAPLALVGMLAARPRSPRFVFGTAAALLLAVYLVYAARVGGDFMGLHRFVMPLFPLGALAVVCGLRVAVERIPATWRWRAAVAAVAAVALIAGHGASQLLLTRESLRWGNFASDHGIDTPAYLRAYARDRALIGMHMHPCLRADDFAIYGGAGAKPYYAGAPGIDVFGLVSERVAHEVPRSRPRPGHNKWAPDRLLLEHAPTFIFSCYSLHRDPRRPQWNCRPETWRRHGYEPVTLHIAGLREKGEYYSFLVKRERGFTCAGMVR